MNNGTILSSSCSAMLNIKDTVTIIIYASFSFSQSSSKVFIQENHFLSPGLISIMRGCTGAYACTQASSESRLSLYEDVLSSDLACPETVMQIRHGSITGWQSHLLTRSCILCVMNVITGRVMCDAAWHTAWQITPTSDGRMKGLWQCSDGIWS